MENNNQGAIFEFTNDSKIGTVESVDTSTVIIKIEDESKLQQIQVNHLVAVQSPLIGQSLIGLVSKIVRKPLDIDSDIESNENIIKVILIGTHFSKIGITYNIFKRTLTTVPSIGAVCILVQGDILRKFMETISTSGNSNANLDIGKYSIDENAIAWLNGNKLFQRHAVIVGSTGSGKSCSVATILEKVTTLKSANVILFDIHGEYSTLQGNGFYHYKIAGPNDQLKENILFLPYWLLTYEEMLTLMLDRSDTNAPNQAMIFSNSVIDNKQKYLDKNNSELKDIITLDSPIPYRLSTLIQDLKKLDTQMVESTSNKDKQGPYFGKLTRFIQRLEAKQNDRRLNFMFSEDEKLFKYNYMLDLCRQIMGSRDNQVKIVDFSEVPSDVLPLMVSLVARLIFSIQQWTSSEERHPISIFCDEAHLYIPNVTDKSIESASLQNFERIAKEGRKYGVGLVVISQRPSEVNRTVLSQSSNFIAMRLTNIDDQSVIKRLLPDSLGDYAEMLPILDIGEAIIVGDASLLPSRIKINLPNQQPKSTTIEFWDKWSEGKSPDYLEKSVESMRKQSKK